MVFSSQGGEGGVPTRRDETSEDTKSTSSSGIVTDCSSSNNDDDDSSSSCSADDYVWTMSEDLREFAERELGETDEVRRNSWSRVRDPVKRSCCFQGTLINRGYFSFYADESLGPNETAGLRLHAATPEAKLPYRQCLPPAIPPRAKVQRGQVGGPSGAISLDEREAPSLVQESWRH